MKKIILKRISDSGYETFGVLIEADTPFCVTLELPEFRNAPNLSCIPSGRYISRRRWYNKGNYDTFQIMNVKDREFILFHKGNTTQDTAGCILLAEQFEKLKVKDNWIPAILRSHKGFKEFMQKLQGEQEFELCIIDYTGLPAIFEKKKHIVSKEVKGYWKDSNF